MPPLMTIGQLARAASVNVETVRYYQRRGLIPTPPRPMGGQRKYNDEALRRIHFVRRAQQLGFTLDEITTLIEVAADRRAVKEIAEEKIERLGERVAELNRMRRQLRQMLATVSADKRGASLVERLHDGEG
jgi:MerR family mercuric resistance operon transcriptional regulator